MRYLRFMPLFLLLLPALFSCDKSLNVNAEWKDVTVVYCLLDQTEDTTYIKITKAFLGEGDALMFSKIPDSSNYPDKLEVRLDEYAVSAAKDTTFVTSHPCDTVTIHNKKPGDSIFYYPNQLMYFTTAKLNANYVYKLYIKNKGTGKIITSQTGLLHDFDVEKPQFNASYIPGENFEVKWTPAQNGKRYQLVIRFCYLEALKTDPENNSLKSVDWLVFNNIKPISVTSTQSFDLYFPANSFYSMINQSIDTSSFVNRVAYRCLYIFTVGATELDTYMEVTEPSLGLIQEKPTYTNIINGIGLFSSRFMKTTDSLPISDPTKAELKINPNTINRGF